MPTNRVQIKAVATVLLCVPVAAMFGFAPMAAAQTASLSQLNTRVVQLEKQVRALEARINTDTIAAPYANAKWVQPANWEKLSIGMTKQQVQNLLGPPMVNNGDQWYWAIQGYGGGNVVFAGDVIHTWQAPPFYSDKFVRKIRGYGE